MSTLSPQGLPHDEPDIETFLTAFESGTLPKDRWTHAAHIFTGAWYVHAFGEPAAIDRMRDRVSAYNLAVGGQNTATSGYHETLTVFWIKLLAHFRDAHPALSRAALAHSAVQEFVDRRNIYAEFYDFDVLKSTEARRIWLAPNLRTFR